MAWRVTAPKTRTRSNEIHLAAGPVWRFFGRLTLRPPMCGNSEQSTAGNCKSPRSHAPMLELAVWLRAFWVTGLLLLASQQWLASRTMMLSWTETFGERKTCSYAWGYCLSCMGEQRYEAKKQTPRPARLFSFSPSPSARGVSANYVPTDPRDSASPAISPSFNTTNSATTHRRRGSASPVRLGRPAIPIPIPATSRPRGAVPLGPQLQSKGRPFPWLVCP